MTVLIVGKNVGVTDGKVVGSLLLVGGEVSLVGRRVGCTLGYWVGFGVGGGDGIWLGRKVGAGTGKYASKAWC